MGAIGLVNFPKKLPFGTNGQFVPNFAQNHPTLYFIIRRKDFSETVQHVVAQQLEKSNSQFPPKFLFCGKWAILAEFGPKLCILVSYNLLKGFFFKFFSMAKHNISTKVTLVNFPKTISLWGKQGTWYIFSPKLWSFVYHDWLQGFFLIHFSTTKHNSVRTKISNKKFTKQVTMFNKTLQIKKDRQRKGMPMLQISNYWLLRYDILKEIALRKES